MISILALVFVITSYFLYVFLVPASVGTSNTQTPLMDNLPSKLDIKIFTDNRFLKLLLRGQFPITIDRVGNNQPIHF